MPDSVGGKSSSTLDSAEEVKEHGSVESNAVAQEHSDESSDDKKKKLSVYALTWTAVNKVSSLYVSDIIQTFNYSNTFVNISLIL